MIFLAVGLIVGMISASIGLGGGILIVPILLFLIPELGHIEVSAASLFAVALSSTSASIAYYRRQLIHIKTALLCSVLAVPGSLLGVYINNNIEKELFSALFGVVLLIYAPVLFFKKKASVKMSAEAPVFEKSFYIKTTISSFFVGIISSFFAIGGGVIYTPLLNSLGMPLLITIGSAQLIIALSSWVATAQHFYYGNINFESSYVLLLGLGMIFGAQLGPSISRRLPSQAILRALSIVLLLIGIRLLAGIFNWSAS